MLPEQAHWAGCLEFVFGTDVSGQVIRHRLPAEHSVHAVPTGGSFTRCGIDAHGLQQLEKPWLEWVDHFRCPTCHVRADQT